MLIRRAVSADIPSLHRLLRQVLEVHHAGRPDLFRGGVTKYTDEELAVLLQDEGRPVFGAFDETGIVGHMIMRFIDEQKTVIRFGFVIVDDKKRGMGCGRRMLELAVKYAFEILGVEKITLGVFENNEPAHMCYKAVGFRETPTGEAKFCRFFGEEWKCLELELKR